MMLADLARKAIPYKWRNYIGCQSLNIASHSSRLLRLYLSLVYNKKVNIKVHKDYNEFEYSGRSIKYPADGTGSILEIFYDHVYDKVYSPKLNDTVIDVGAYAGMWTVRAALQVGEKGQVIAIEPIISNCNFLEHNTKGLPVKLLRCVASDKDGTEYLYLSDKTSTPSTVIRQKYFIKVEAKAIDTIASKVDFIKIDAEGAELKVLEGAVKTLKQNDVKLSIASYSQLNEEDLIAKFLYGLGYKVTVEKGLRSYIYAEKIA